MRNFIKRVSKSLYYIVIPIIVLLIICTESVISIWIGGDNIQMLTVSTIVLVSFNLLFATTLMPFYIFIRVKNHPDKEIYIQGINVLLNLIVIFLSFNYLGYYSVILGNVVSLLAASAMCIYYQKKYLDFYSFSGIKDILKYVLSGVLVGIATFFFFLIFTNRGWIEIISTSLFSCLVSMVIFYSSGAIKKEDYKIFKT